MQGRWDRRDSWDQSMRAEARLSKRRAQKGPRGSDRQALAPPAPFSFPQPTIPSYRPPSSFLPRNLHFLSPHFSSPSPCLFPSITPFLPHPSLTPHLLLPFSFLPSLSSSLRLLLTSSPSLPAPLMRLRRRGRSGAACSGGGTGGGGGPAG